MESLLLIHKTGGRLPPQTLCLVLARLTMKERAILVYLPGGGVHRLFQRGAIDDLEIAVGGQGIADVIDKPLLHKGGEIFHRGGIKLIGVR